MPGPRMGDRLDDAQLKVVRDAGSEIRGWPC